MIAPTAVQAGPHDCDVLVVGLGPVGDVLAGLARLHRLTVIAIDKEAALYPLPRAAVFDHEVMRIFQMLGIADEIGALCRIPDRYEFVSGNGDVLLDFPLAALVPDSGWAESYALHQPAVEAALAARIVALGVDVRRGVRFAGLVQDADGVTARVETSVGEKAIRARYLVGCDGAWSPVREAIGVPLFDYQFDEPWLVLDTLCSDPRDLPLTLRQVCDPRRPFTYMPMSGNRFRWEFMIKPGEDPAALLTDASIEHLLGPWVALDSITIERRAVYRFHGLVARQWRAGRVLIAGDAAHQMPPFAGQGMCSGIRDANNLAWKLAMAVRGEADPALLDSYQAEREPHVRAIIETAIAMGRTVCILDDTAAAARDAAMLADRAAGMQAISVRHPDLRGGLLSDSPRAGALFPQAISGDARIDALLDRHVTLIGRDLPADAPGVRAIALDDPCLARFAPTIDAWLDGASAVLVRPDRHVFGTGEPDALLRDWYARLAVPAYA